MIRLTLNAHSSDPEIYLFNQSTILLGSDPTLTDLLLQGPDIQSIHLKILKQNGFPIISNDANDPFVSVNGHPFGKKLLNSGDIILVHQTTILFENFNTSNSIRHNGSEESASLLQNKIKKNEGDVPLEGEHSSIELKPHSSFPLSFEQEVEVLKDEEFQKESYGTYINGLESSQEKPKSTQPSSNAEQFRRENKQSASLKDDYLRELEDDNQQKNIGPFGRLKEHSHFYLAWKSILIFIFCLIAISCLIGTIIYFSVSDKSEAQETKASQGVADLAMALTHAQLNHLRPHNQNWSDVEFLKTNLQTILPESFSYASQIDAQGQFNSCPYCLRIYTNSDLSHFLLIAQPAPNLLYWLIPQSIIVVDSHLMELRTLKDVRSLNRMLANHDPLEGPNGKEILSLIKQGELIRLSDLAVDSSNPEFAPPTNLAWSHPGAENFIYNAPRFFRLGQNIVDKAISLSTSKSSSKEVGELKQNVENFAKLNHLILYSVQDKKLAQLTRQNLMLFAPSDKLLFGYLLFNAQGKIYQTYLLEDEEESKEAPIEINHEQEELIAYQPVLEVDDKEELKNQNSSLDLNHPIFIQLHSLVSARENELKPLISTLTSLINQELITPRGQFQVEYQKLSFSYLMANSKHKKILKESLDGLFIQYENIPIEQFISYIRELNLEQLILQKEQTISVIEENYQQNMVALFTQIKNTKSLTELNNIIHMAINWLNFEYIKDSKELIKYYNLLRNQILDQLERWLLTKKILLILKPGDKTTLQNILNQERLIKADEREFFLSEFEEFFLFSKKKCTLNSISVIW